MEMGTRTDIFTDIFEWATRSHARWAHKGVCSAEDLWELPLDSLDAIFKKLNSEVRSRQEDSLLVKKSKEDEEVLLKIAVVKHIVKVKVNEAELRKHNIERSRRKRKLLEIKADKQDEVLKNMSLEDLDKLIDEL